MIEIYWYKKLNTYHTTSTIHFKGKYIVYQSIKQKQSPGFLFDHCTFSAARCAIVKCIWWKLKQVQNKLIPPWDQHSAAGTSPPCAWVTAHLICPLLSHVPAPISDPGPYKLLILALSCSDTINTAWIMRPLNCSLRITWAIYRQIMPPRSLQNVVWFLWEWWWKVTVS